MLIKCILAIILLTSAAEAQSRQQVAADTLRPNQTRIYIWPEKSSSFIVKSKAGSTPWKMPESRIYYYYQQYYPTYYNLLPYYYSTSYCGLDLR